MLSRLIRALPRDWLVYMYKTMPFKGIKDYAVRQAQVKFLVSVLGVITDSSGRVMLLKHTYREEPWGIPGGWMEGEKPEEGMAREIREETGLSVKRLRLVKAIYGQKPDRVDLIFRGELGGESGKKGFQSNSEISEMLLCRPGDWPKGLPEDQKKLITELLREER
ncbi:NUDIX hydrolase [Paenibacillus jiagnxiensis]|uniref:NUDIX hydrolase n=1 Tax=Paenibacillus jiagnxiensis TaxID=3228926 RepID=UPI0033ADF819